MNKINFTMKLWRFVISILERTKKKQPDSFPILMQDRIIAAKGDREKIGELIAAIRYEAYMQGVDDMREQYSDPGDPDDQ